LLDKLQSRIAFPHACQYALLVLGVLVFTSTSFAREAAPRTVSDRNVVWAERMPPLAACTVRRPTPDVLQVGDWLQVVWVNACPVPAYVIELETGWNRTDENVVHKAIRRSDSAGGVLPGVGGPIALLADVAKPEPAPIRFLDAVVEQLLYGLSAFSGRHSFSPATPPAIQGGSEAGEHSVFDMACKAMSIPTGKYSTSQWKARSNSPVGKREVQA
jgi:hypothetical protein